MDFQWDDEKNNKLKQERGVSFEDVVYAIQNKQVLDVIINPSSNFDHHQCFVLSISHYIYLVPFVKKGDAIFLKTIFLSRKHKKYYLTQKGKHEK
ncbi:MAG: hypothetical protein Rsou_0927 [Candidatus Ruthia sp. Asou_11_S2]|nr:hypothetical protein [Candidatus Ruthia sp. Asou_11_S2]